MSETKAEERVTKEEIKKHFVTLYWRRISHRITASIGILKNDQRTSQFLTLFIEDEKTGMWINLKLSTLRKIVKFIHKKDLFKPRRLNEVEKMMLGRL